MAADLHIHAAPRHWSDRHLRQVLAVFLAHTLDSKWSTFALDHFNEERILASDASEEDKQQWLKELRLAGLSEGDAQLVREVSQLEKSPFWDLLHDGAYHKIAETDNVWVGEVSWLKAFLLGQPDVYVPNPVVAVSDLLGEELSVLDEELAKQILAALKTPNQTTYKISNPLPVEKFLRDHMGLRLFTVSW